MKKRKTYEVSVINKTYSKTYSDQTKFYTSDTALELNFQLKEVEYDFDSAEIILLNVDDRSLATRPVTKSAEGFTYELEDDIVEHYGEWKGQLKFNEGCEIYVSSPVSFRIDNDLNNDRPPQLTDVRDWEMLKQSAKDLIVEMGDAVTNEAARVEAENIRVSGYQEIRNIVDNFEIGENAVGTENLKDAAVTEYKTNFINYSVNLFNKDTVHKEIGGYYSGPNFIEKANMDTYFVRVRPGMTITTSTNPINTISFWDESFNYLEYVSYSQTMSVPNNNDIAWASIPVSTSLNVNEIMIVEGESLPETYIPFQHTLSDYIGISSGALEPLVDKGNVSKNMFDKDAVRIGYEVNGNNSQVLPHSDSVVSANINVEGMSNIYLSGLPTYNVGGASNLGYDRYYAFYDESGVPLAESLGTIPRSATEQLVNVPDNAKEFAFTIFQRKTTSESENVSTIMVEEGRTKSRFEPYELGMVGLAGYKFKTGTTADEILPTEGKVGLFFGDSITQTAVVSDDGVEYYEGRRSNWPKFAYDMLKLGGMWNYAQSGASFKDRSLEPRQYLGHQVDTAISNDRPADIIVVSCGTNDGAATIGDYDISMSKGSLSELDVTNLYESIRYSFWKLRTHYPNATMYAALPIQRVAREQPEELIEAITKMAHRYNFIIIDGLRESGIVRDFEISGGNGRYLEDGLHPNVDGQIKMAKLYSRVIKNTYVE